MNNKANLSKTSIDDNGTTHYYTHRRRKSDAHIERKIESAKRWHLLLHGREMSESEAQEMMQAEKEAQYGYSWNAVGDPSQGNYPLEKAIRQGSHKPERLGF